MTCAPQQVQVLICSLKSEMVADGNPEQWANESAKLAQAAWVSDGTDLDERYYETEIKVVDKQMALAGLRLSKLLNETIGADADRFCHRSQSQIAAAATASVLPNAARDAGSYIRVWVNTKSDAYHCPETPWYGKTKQGQ
jgi:S1/P1 Nuclease